jgi:ABC-type dipeptide/oligopeptide/nickel transport system permease subunit
VAAFVLGEAGLSFLGIGDQTPTPSWGKTASSVGADGAVIVVAGAAE